MWRKVSSSKWNVIDCVSIFLDRDTILLLEAPIRAPDDSFCVYLETANFVLEMHLVPQFVSDFGRVGLIRQRIEKWRDYRTTFLNFCSWAEIRFLQWIIFLLVLIPSCCSSNISTQEQKFKKVVGWSLRFSILCRMRPTRPKSDKNCGTRCIFRKTYFFCTKYLFSFFLEIFIGWKFDSLRDRPVSISKKHFSSIGLQEAEIHSWGGGGP